MEQRGVGCREGGVIEADSWPEWTRDDMATVWMVENKCPYSSVGNCRNCQWHKHQVWSMRNEFGPRVKWRSVIWHNLFLREVEYHQSESANAVTACPYKLSGELKMKEYANVQMTNEWLTTLVLCSTVSPTKVPLSHLPNAYWNMFPHPYLTLRQISIHGQIMRTWAFGHRQTSHTPAKKHDQAKLKETQLWNI